MALQDTVTASLDLIRAEYREMPGLALTVEQAQCLWNLDAATCERLLEHLRLSGVLRRSPDGRYRRGNVDPVRENQR